MVRRRHAVLDAVLDRACQQAPIDDPTAAARKAIYEDWIRRTNWLERSKALNSLEPAAREVERAKLSAEYHWLHENTPPPPPPEGFATHQEFMQWLRSQTPRTLIGFYRAALNGEGDRAIADFRRSEAAHNRQA
jgi:hypothetical protein